MNKNALYAAIIFWPVIMAIVVARPGSLFFLSPLVWVALVYYVARLLKKDDLRAVAGNVLVSFSQLLNAVTGGDPDETFSGRMGKAIAGGRCVLCKPVCALLDWLDKPGHCQRFAEPDEGARDVVDL